MANLQNKFDETTGFFMNNKGFNYPVSFPSNFQGAGDDFNYLSGWNPDNIYEIIIDSSKIDSTLTHFPIPIILDVDHSDFFDKLVDVNNQALNKTHYANNSFGDPDNMVDENLTTYCQQMSYIAVDEINSIIGRVKIATFNTTSLSTMQSDEPVFQGSNDSTDGSDGSWTTLTTIESADIVALDSYPGWCTDKIFDNETKYQWYRLSGLTNSSNTVICEWELIQSASASQFKVAVADSNGNQLYAERELFEVDVNIALLIHSDNTDGSTDFVDSSVNNHIITAHGDIHHETDVSGFNDTTIYANGTGNYLSVAESEHWNFSNNKFLVAGKFYFTSVGTWEGIMGQWVNPSNRGWGIFLNGSSYIEFAYTTDGSTHIPKATTFAPSINTWYHIAVEYDGANLVIYVDGSVELSSAFSATIFNSTAPLEIASCDANGAYMYGYFEEIIIINNEVKWGEAFTPPEVPYSAQKALFHVSSPDLELSSTEDTKLYLYYDNTQEDNHEYVGAMGHGDDVLMIRADQEDESTNITDSSPSEHTITVNNVTHQDTESYIGDTSLYFSASNSYLSLADHTDFAMGSNDFTQHFFFKRNRTSTREIICGQMNSGGASVSCNLYIELQATNDIRLMQGYNSGASYFILSPGLSVTDTNWHYLKVIRNGNTVSVQLDSTVGATTQDVTGYTFTDQALPYVIGKAGSYSGLYFRGYIEEFEIIKGRAITSTDIPTRMGNPAHAVWDANYKAVYHMNQDPSGGTDCIKDSTNNNNHGTPSGMESGDLVDGLFGKALSFDGVNESIANGIDLGLLGNFEGSIEAVIKPSSVSGFTIVCVAGVAQAGRSFSLCINVEELHCAYNGGRYIETTTEPLSVDTRYVLTVTKTAGLINATTALYVDGVLVTDIIGSETTPNFAPGVNYTGTWTNGAYDYEGLIESLTWSNVQRSAAWAKAMHAAQTNTLLTIEEKT